MLEVDAEADWWDTMSDEVKADIETAIRQADKGEVHSHDEVRKNIRSAPNFLLLPGISQTKPLIQQLYREIHAAG